MHGTRNRDYISHASWQVAVAMAPGSEGKKFQKRKRHKGEPPNLCTNFSNPSTCVEDARMPQGKTAAGRLKKRSGTEILAATLMLER